MSWDNVRRRGVRDRPWGIGQTERAAVARAQL